MAIVRLAARIGRRPRKPVDTSITLLPLLDILLIVVVMLLMVFSASGEVYPSALDLELPRARHGDDLQMAPIIRIDGAQVTLDGHSVADTNALLSTSRVQRIDALVEGLATARRNWGMLHPREPFPGRVMLEADRKVDFRAVRKVLFSAAQAGCSNVSLVVLVPR